jgi:hypothetical protein
MGIFRLSPERCFMAKIPDKSTKKKMKDGIKVHESHPGSC